MGSVYENPLRSTDCEVQGWRSSTDEVVQSVLRVEPHVTACFALASALTLYFSHLMEPITRSTF